MVDATHGTLLITAEYFDALLSGGVVVSRRVRAAAVQGGEMMWCQHERC